MQTASGIQFKHFRKEYQKVGQEFVPGDMVELNDLPILALKTISVDKQCKKLYTTISQRASSYLPEGMIGPTVNLTCSATCSLDSYEIYSNDVLQVTTFDYTTWRDILPVNSTWWVDVYSNVADSNAKPKDGKVRYSVTLNIYKRKY